MKNVIGYILIAIPILFVANEMIKDLGGWLAMLPAIIIGSAYSLLVVYLITSKEDTNGIEAQTQAKKMRKEKEI